VVLLGVLVELLLLLLWATVLAERAFWVWGQHAVWHVW
jgi:hypothetical protein